MENEEIITGFLQELRRGTIVLAVLSQLKKEMYGYSLVQILGEKGMPVEANTLYPLLRRLESQGLLQSSWETSGAKPRKYYSITEQGKTVYELLLTQWEKISDGMYDLLHGNETGSEKGGKDE
ncbi:MAG TPA: PadR family transcriptional regulator [Treponemataceae bacterium]|nr:PadR family transcriptional regulator [Treponemataceae bacterium]